MKQELLCPLCQANLMEGVYHERDIHLFPTKEPNLFRVDSLTTCDEEWIGLCCQKCGAGFVENEYEAFWDQLNAYEVESIIGKQVQDEHLYQMIEQWNQKCPKCEQEAVDTSFEEVGIYNDYLVHYQYNPLENKFEFNRLETIWRGKVPGEGAFIRCGCCNEVLD